MKTEIVTPPAPPVPRVQPTSALAGARVAVAPLVDAHAEAFAGTITSLGTPTYRASFSPPLTDVVRAALEHELTAGGATLVAPEAADIVVEGSVDCGVSNDSTPLFWDVHVDLSVSLVARRRRGGATLAAEPFRTRETERTFLYPSHEVIGAALASALEGFSQSLRAPDGLFERIGEARK